MMPEFTRPTSITVTAEEDWTAMVMPAPKSRPFMGLEVMRFNSRSNRPPAEEIRSMTSFYGRCPWIPEPEEASESDKAEE